MKVNIVSMLTTLTRKKTTLIFIEFQKEWVGQQAFLKNLLVKDKAPFEEAIQNAGKILHKARVKDWIIAHAGLYLSDDPDYLLFAEGKDKLGLRNAIPKAGTWMEAGAQFAQPFVPQKGEFIVKGRSGASVLKNSTLDPYLRNNDINTLILMGFATHVCVESTLREAHDLGYNAYVVLDACGAFEKAQTSYFEDHIVHHFGTAVKTVELLNAL